MATTPSLTDLNQQRKLAAAQAAYAAKQAALNPAPAPLTNVQVAALAATPVPVAAATPVPVPTPAAVVLAPAPVAAPVPVVQVPVQTNTAQQVQTLQAAVAAPAPTTTLPSVVQATDPARAALTAAATATPSTPAPSPAASLLPAPVATPVAAPAAVPTSTFTPAQQTAIDLQRQITPDMPLEQQRAIKQQFIAAYQALPTQEARLAVTKELQAPSSANKLAGVRYSATIPIARGESDLSDEQLARLALAEQVKAANPTANAAQTQAAFTAALQTPGALDTPEIRASVAAATGGLQARSDELNALLPGSNIDLVGDRNTQQAATAAATQQVIDERNAAAIAGVTPPNPEAARGTAVGLPLQVSNTAEIDQRPMAQLATARAANGLSAAPVLPTDRLSATEARSLNPGATLAADPAGTQALIDKINAEAAAGLRNPSNAAAQVRALQAKLQVGGPTGRTNKEIFADPTLTRDQRLAEMSLNSQKTPAAALGIRSIQVIRAKSGQSDLPDDKLIALARALAPPGTPLPTNIVDAQALLQSGLV